MKDWFFWTNVLLAIMIIFFTWIEFEGYMMMITVFASAIILLHIFYSAYEEKMSG